MITNQSFTTDSRMAEWRQTAKAALRQWQSLLEDVDDPLDPYWARTIAQTFQSRFFQGLHRTVFIKNNCAVKIDHGSGSANQAEWKRWFNLSATAREHVVIPYCMTKCGTVLVVEKLRTWEIVRERCAIEKQVAKTLEQCPEIARIPDCGNYDNWAFRKNRAVLLDLAGYGH